mgnify:FL=1
MTMVKCGLCALMYFPVVPTYIIIISVHAFKNLDLSNIVRHKKLCIPYHVSRWAKDGLVPYGMSMTWSLSVTQWKGKEIGNLEMRV